MAYTLKLAVKVCFATEEVNELIKKKSGKFFGFFSRINVRSDGTGNCTSALQGGETSFDSVVQDQMEQLFHRLDEQKQYAHAALSYKIVITVAKEESLS